MRLNTRKAGYIRFLIIFLTAMLGYGLSAGPSDGYHKYIMRGSIVEVEDGKIYLCIGSADGAKVGQELNVYNIRVQRKEGKVSHRMIREKVGMVRIESIVDEHFANAKVISGKAEKHDIVELESMKR